MSLSGDINWHFSLMDEFDVDCWRFRILAGMTIAQTRAVIQGIYVELVAIATSVYASLSISQLFLFWSVIFIVVTTQLVQFGDLMLKTFMPTPVAVVHTCPCAAQGTTTDMVVSRYVCQIVYLLTSLALTPRLSPLRNPMLKALTQR